MLGMKPLARDALRFIQCLGLGLWIAVMPFVLAGGIYEIVTGSPSDGFLFETIVFIVPWFAVVMVVVPVACWNHQAFLVLSRWLAMLFLAVLLLIWCLPH